MSEEKKADSLLARQLAIPLYGDKKLFTGEARLAHADGMANIVRGIRDDEELILFSTEVSLLMMKVGE